MESDPSLGFEPHNYECLVGEEADRDGDHADLGPSKDCPKDQGEELIKTNLAGGEKKRSLSS